MRIAELDKDEAHLDWEVGMANQPDAQVGVDRPAVRLSKRHHVRVVECREQAGQNAIPAVRFGRQRHRRSSLTNGCSSLRTGRLARGLRGVEPARQGDRRDHRRREREAESRRVSHSYPPGRTTKDQRPETLVVDILHHVM
jgi:hypothetical protein